jgi:hypothetical protein
MISSRSAGPMRACRKMFNDLQVAAVMMLSITLMLVAPDSGTYWLPITATWWRGHVKRSGRGDQPSCGVYTPLMQLSIELLPRAVGADDGAHAPSTLKDAVQRLDAAKRRLKCC